MWRGWCFRDHRNNKHFQGTRNLAKVDKLIVYILRLVDMRSVLNCFVKYEVCMKWPTLFRCTGIRVDTGQLPLDIKWYTHSKADHQRQQQPYARLFLFIPTSTYNLYQYKRHDWYMEYCNWCTICPKLSTSKLKRVALYIKVIRKVCGLHFHV